jgi:hypothetical protein
MNVRRDECMVFSIKKCFWEFLIFLILNDFLYHFNIKNKFLKNKNKILF